MTEKNTPLMAAYLQACAQGVDLLAECAGMTAAQLTEMGASAGHARELAHLAQVYWGTTTFSGRQRRAVAAARERGHSLAALRDIEAWVSKVKDTTQAWRLREELCGSAEADIAWKARARLKAWRRVRKPRPQARLAQHGEGLATLSITASSSLLTQLHNSLDKADVSGSLGEIVEQGTSPTLVVTHAVVKIEDLAAIREGKGDDIIVQLTNGATMTGAEYLNSRLAQCGFSTLISPIHGPVNLYRTQRFASDKQRLMLLAESPCCAWPGCRVAGELSQFHHIIPWRAGGETNVANMAVTCAFHNAACEHPQKYGRLERRRGTLTWTPPGKAAVGLRA